MISAEYDIIFPPSIYSTSVFYKTVPQHEHMLAVDIALSIDTQKVVTPYQKNLTTKFFSVLSTPTKIMKSSDFTAQPSKSSQTHNYQNFADLFQSEP